MPMVVTKTSRHQVDADIKNRIVGSVVHGTKICEAAKENHVPPKTTCNIVKKFCLTGSVANCPSSGKYFCYRADQNSVDVDAAGSCFVEVSR